jgi:hypothetical protein
MALNNLARAHIYENACRSDRTWIKFGGKKQSGKCLVEGRHRREPPIHHLPCRPSETATLVSVQKSKIIGTFSFAETATGRHARRQTDEVEPAEHAAPIDAGRVSGELARHRPGPRGRAQWWLPRRRPSRRLSTLTIVVAAGPADGPV